MHPNNPPPPPPWGLPWRSSTPFITSTLTLATATDLFLYGLVVPVLPFLLSERLSLGRDEVQSGVALLLAVYAGASCAVAPVVGVVGDRVARKGDGDEDGEERVGMCMVGGRKGLFVGSLGLLVVATVGFALARDMAGLVAARVAQGLSAGVVWTLAMAILVETVGQENLGVAMGTMYSFTGAAGLFAPVAGGWLYDKTGFNGVFGVGMALVGVDFVLRALMIEKKVRDDYMSSSSGTTTSTVQHAEHAEQTPLLRSSSPTEQPPTPDQRYRLSPPNHRITHGFPILLLFRDPGLLTALFIAFMQAVLLGSFDATVPLVAESTFDFTSLTAGLLFLPLGGADMLFGPVFGWAVGRYGPRLFSVLGFALLVPSLVLLRLPLALEGVLDEGRRIALFVGLLALNGVGLAVVGSPGVVEAGRLVENYTRANEEIFPDGPPWAQLYGVNSMVFSAGLSVGPLVAGALTECIGYGGMNAVLGGACAVTAGLAAVFVGRKGGA